jgi:hypothetical protein
VFLAPSTAAADGALVWVVLHAAMRAWRESLVLGLLLLLLLLLLGWA